MNLVIRNGRVIDPASGHDAQADIWISEGRIRSIGRKPRGLTAEHSINARGLWVLPGLVDLSTHLREPGAEHKATVASELYAAAANGFTTVCQPPDTDPPIDAPSVVELINHRAEPVAGARVVCLGALTVGLAGEQLAEMAALREIGCVGVSNGSRAVVDTRLLSRAFQYAEGVGMTVHHLAREPWLSRGAGVNHSALSVRQGLPGEPAIAEAIEIHRALLVAEQTGVRLHLGRISSAGSTEILTRATRDPRITADVALANLACTEALLSNHSGLYRVEPALRAERDREALARAIRKGTIAAITSNHAPHDADAKDGAFMACEAGLSTLDGFLPVLLGLATEWDIAPAAMLSLVTSAPGAILGLESGHIEVGLPADLTLYDPAHAWRLEPSELFSRGKNSPFIGSQLTGRVHSTLVDGELVFCRD